jgi:hypothetical protein
MVDGPGGVPTGAPLDKKWAAFGRGDRQYGGMPDLMREDARDFFDPEYMGALPNVFVPGASVKDWQGVFDLVRTNGWRWEYWMGGTSRRLPTAVNALPRSLDDESPTLKVWPVPGVQANFFLMSAEQIDFDLDLRELQGPEGVDVLCAFFRAIGRRLAKPEKLISEGNTGDAVLEFDPSLDRVVLLADPLPPGHYIHRLRTPAEDPTT